MKPYITLKNGKKISWRSIDKSVVLFGWSLGIYWSSYWTECAHKPPFTWQLFRFSRCLNLTRHWPNYRLWVYPRRGAAFYFELYRLREMS
jgi:hypothetical protein